MSADIQWHSGPPPHVGWWVASSQRDGRCFRWWDGRDWSRPCFPSLDEKLAANVARCPTDDTRPIEWCYWWPIDARVPRINPDNGEVTGGVAPIPKANPNDPKLTEVYVNLQYESSDGFTVGQEFNTKRVSPGGMIGTPKTVLLGALEELARLTALFGFEDEAKQRFDSARERVFAFRTARKDSHV